jgi:hypothetical protein
MAKETAKKNARSNATRLQWFRTVTTVINAVYLLNLLVWTEGPMFSVWSIFWMLFWATQEYVALVVLTTHGTAELDASGDVVDCIDLSDPQQLGIYSYAQDLMWVCWAVQLLTCVSNWFLVLYLPVPITAVVKALPLLQGMFSRSRGPQQTGGMEQPEDDLRSRLQRRRDQIRQRKGKPVKE